MKPNDIRHNRGTFKFYSMAIIALGLVAYVAFLFGNSHFAEQRAQIKTLHHTLDNLSQENEKLTRQINILGVEVEVQKLAAQRAQSVIEQGLNRESELKQELLFYQKVMAPELKQQGFAIEAAEIKPTSSDGVYWLSIVLMQQEAIKNVLKGTLDIQVTGSQQGKPSTLTLKNIALDQAEKLTFSFKYFQVIEQQIKLPQDFKAEQLIVHAEIYQFKRKRGELKTSFPWQEVARQAEEIAK